MIVHCVVRKQNDEVPVEVFVDVRTALLKYEELSALGETGLSIYATEI